MLLDPMEAMFQKVLLSEKAVELMIEFQTLKVDPSYTVKGIIKLLNEKRDEIEKIAVIRKSNLEMIIAFLALLNQIPRYSSIYHFLKGSLEFGVGWDYEMICNSADRLFNLQEALRKQEEKIQKDEKRKKRNEKKNKKKGIVCERCYREGHETNVCYSKKDKFGAVLEKRKSEKEKIEEKKSLLRQYFPESDVDDYCNWTGVAAVCRDQILSKLETDSDSDCIM